MFRRFLCGQVEVRFPTSDLTLRSDRSSVFLRPLTLPCDRTKRGLANQTPAMVGPPHLSAFAVGDLSQSTEDGTEDVWKGHTQMKDVTMWIT